MTALSLGIRSSGSYGSLQQLRFPNDLSSPPENQQPQVSRKAKMLKDKEKLFHIAFKFAPRREVGMLLLSLVSIAFILLLTIVARGEDPQEDAVALINIFPGPLSDEKFDVDKILVSPLSEVARIENSSLQPRPPPSVFFTGYKLPPGNPCHDFALPPPPADKKRIGPRQCPVCYLPLEEAIALMPRAASFSPLVKDLSYIHEENLTRSEFGGSRFGGYPSLEQRKKSYDIKESMSLHCGFVKGVKPGNQTGFDIGDSDLPEMENCRGIVVASAIFGAFDIIRQPKNMSEYTKQNACFHMFVDEETKDFLHNSTELNSGMKVGLWRIIVVQNLPYSDPRRNGKIPKLLLHRLFPNARFSLWIDAKLELVVDPIQILERFLWRRNASFAISRHYKRFDVFVEAEANKAAAKYDNSSIDFQIDFYRKEGLTPYSEKKLPITSDVPEGCVIIREHIPITNLFTCLWFNEVDRFTSRDQLSFSTVRDKIRSETNYTVDMFLDCERRNFVIQGYHRDVLEQRFTPPPPPPPPRIVNGDEKGIADGRMRKLPAKQKRERRSRRHRKIVADGNRVV